MNSHATMHPTHFFFSQVPVTDSAIHNPLNNSMKSSQQFKQARLGSGTSLIKEDSNEEKSSSNSNSNNEMIIYPEIKPIEKTEIFSKKLSFILNKSKHRRQKTI